jgi:4-hydroxy-tetrahydrodipicolinate synthase
MIRYRPRRPQPDTFWFDKIEEELTTTISADRGKKAAEAGGFRSTPILDNNARVPPGPPTRARDPPDPAPPRRRAADRLLGQAALRGWARAHSEDRIMTARTSFRGSFTALVTPFNNGSLDEKAFRGLVDWQIAEGTSGLVPVGTTGESPTLSHEEHDQVVAWCIEQAKGRVPVIAGAGSNSTKEAVELARHAQESGADAVLVVTPYYNKPTQEGLYQHFKAINDAIRIPIIIYNIPARSVIDMSVDTMKRLFDLDNIAGVKDATANVVRVSQQRAAMGEDFNQLSGEDATALGFMAHGGHGCISVTSNVAPRLCADFQSACLRGDCGTALKLQDKLMPLHTALFIETNPAPAKYALSLLGKCADTVRLPMVRLADKTKTAVREAMVHAGLIN